MTSTRRALTGVDGKRGDGVEAPISPLTAAEVAELNEVYRKHASVGVGDICEMPSDVSD